MDLKALSKPFNESEIEWRIGQCGDTNGKIWGFCLAYIQARAVMDRLDEVCGQENWKVSYENVASGTFCTLSIKIENEWVSKQDGSDPSELEAFKGAVSGSLKRAGSVWGIGRYLYGLDSNMFIQVVEKNTPGSQYGKTKDGKTFHWLPPALPGWAIPKLGVHPDQPEMGDGVPHDDGVFRVKFGKYNKRKLEEIDLSELRNYINYLESSAKKKGVPIQGQVLEFIERASSHIAAIENSNLDAAINEMEPGSNG